MLAVELDHVTKRFGEVTALSDVSLRVDRGEFLCLFGPSGCGKTTALRLIAGLEVPDAGRVLIHGSVASDQTVIIPPVDRNVGMVFQDLALWPHMRAARHIDFVLRGRGLSKVERRERVRRLLALSQLEDRRRTYPNQLSGGEAQRLAIARALATDPGILLLDEPFANLDVPRRHRVIDEVLRRKDTDGLAIVMATHNRQEAEDISDTVFDMA
jgi:ABC-type Fe3+/spermidine/putrescine transport system ATPase subunit